PAGQHAAQKNPPVARAATEAAHAPKRRQAREGQEPDPGMKHPVPEHVDLRADEVRHGNHAREHVVPLQQLMQDDAVEEAAEARAGQQAGRDEGRTMGLGHGWGLGKIALENRASAPHTRARSPMKASGESKAAARNANASLNTPAYTEGRQTSQAFATPGAP